MDLPLGEGGGGVKEINWINFTNSTNSKQIFNRAAA